MRIQREELQMGRNSCWKEDEVVVWEGEQAAA